MQGILPSKRVNDGDSYHHSHCLAVVGADFTSSYLVGKIFLQNARELVGKKGEKENMIWNKTNALKFLEKARTQAQELDRVPLAEVDDDLADLEEREREQEKESGYVAVVAQDYDVALYLMWGTKNTASGNE